MSGGSWCELSPSVIPIAFRPALQGLSFAEWRPLLAQAFRFPEDVRIEAVNHCGSSFTRANDPGGLYILDLSGNVPPGRLVCHISPGPAVFKPWVDDHCARCRCLYHRLAGVT